MSQFATKIQKRFTEVERALTLQHNVETKEAVRNLLVKLERMEERLNRRPLLDSTRPSLRTSIQSNSYVAPTALDLENRILQHARPPT
ncbi:MAG: hypothetical protein MHM6MM_006069, partial [Cercozoa sp. M6MM]